MPILLPSLPEAGTLAYAWVDPAGVVRNLSGNTTGVNVMVGERGLGLPPIDLAEDKLPFGAGTIVRHAAIGSRMIDLPLEFSAATPSGLEGLLDSVYGYFATADEQQRTPGYLRVTRRDGSQRQLACYYAGGLEGDLASERAGDTWQEATVVLKAADPWATAIEDTVLTYGQADFGSEHVIINPGQLEAFPIWTAIGPWAVGTPSIEIENTVTGEAWRFNFAILSTLGVIVDTRPASQRTTLGVRRYPDDLNLFSFLVKPSQIWHLAPGENRFTMTFAGGVTAGTSVELRYRPRYRGLLR